MTRSNELYAFVSNNGATGVAGLLGFYRRAYGGEIIQSDLYIAYEVCCASVLVVTV